jgi:hypothetical protein
MSRRRVPKLSTLAAALPLAAMLGCDADVSKGDRLATTHAALVARAVPAAVAAPKLSFALAVGDSGVHRLTYTGTSEVDFGLLSSSLASGVGAQDKTASRRVASKHARTASLHWRVISEDAAGWILAARLQDVVFRFDDATDPRKDLLEQPFTLRLDRKGQMGDFTFRKNYPAELALAVRGLVEPLEVTLDDDGDGAWSAREEQQEANLVTQYRNAGVDAATGATTLIRSVTSATPTKAYARSLAPLGKVTVSVIDAESTFELEPNGRGVQSVHTRQTVTANSRKGFVSSHSDVYVAELTAGRLATLPTTVTEAAEILAKGVEKNLYEVDASALPQVAGRDVKAFMADYATTLAANTARAHRLMTNYVRHYPERSLEVARALDAWTGEDPEAFIGFGFSAMATAGHVEAQRALVTVVTGSDWRGLSRERALVAMIELEAPQPETMDAVWALRSSPPGNAVFAATIESMATNVYGSFGFVQKADKDVTSRVVRDLAGLLDGQAELKQQVFALSALSNVGDPETVLPLVAPFFKSSEERLRSRAFGTFRRMTGSGVIEAFAARYDAEQSSEVRLAAVRTAEQMEPSAERNAWALREAARETNPDAMRGLVSILGLGLEAHPDNASFLRSLLDTQTDRAVRRAIYAFVTPQAQGCAK